MHAHAADAVAAARKKWEFGVDEDDAIEQAQWEEKVQAARREAFEEAAKLARQCLLLDREPYTPTDGQQTGDMIVVGMRDWYRHKRLARMIARAAEEGSDNG
jgi:8-oxo-dGTP pyrophosphatase MutT (NUDIX family)